MADRRTVASYIRAQLAERKSRTLLRGEHSPQQRLDGPYVEREGKRYLSFLSNDYLGLSQDKVWQKMVAESFASFRPSSSGSRLAGGWDAETLMAEKAFADYFGYDECLFFPSGYQGNLALMTGLIGRGQPVFVDRRIHASCAHALAASGAELHPYAHNDLAHLERRLQKLSSTWQPVVVTESLFSMDGTVSDAAAFAALKKRYDFFLIVDEAHAAGCLGKGGRGLFTVHRTADVVLGTLGKGCGFFGAFALLPAGFTQALENMASAVMHSTALPPAHAQACLRLAELLPALDDRREKLAEHARYFRQELERLGIASQGQAHIVSVPLGQEKKAQEAALALQREGILVLAARHPTVPYGQSLLRFSVTALHEKEVLRSVAEVLGKLL